MHTNPYSVNSKSKIYRFLYESFSLFICFLDTVFDVGISLCSRHYLLSRFFRIVRMSETCPQSSSLHQVEANEFQNTKDRNRSVVQVSLRRVVSKEQSDNWRQVRHLFLPRLCRLQPILLTLYVSSLFCFFLGQIKSIYS